LLFTLRDGVSAATLHRAWLEPITKIFHNGYLGVNVFFVLSGFLITSLLIREETQSGTIVKKFFIRRTLRIFPAYYFFACLTRYCRLAQL
jgi:peptidoglycan/LPS O-acetylase OafA/YrhL